MDAHKNFAYSLVATAPSPATSGTSLVVSSGEGSRFPAVPFNATIWPTGTKPTPANAEIVRVTAISTDTLTITRAQEGTTARSVIVGDQIAATITALTLTDAEQADGWQQDNAAWTRTGNNTFTVSGDLTAKFRKGTRIKVTDTTTKYFVVIGSSHAAGTTTVTIGAGTDYTLAADPTARWYSYQLAPQGYPSYFTYTPTYVGWTTPPSGLARFAIEGNICKVWHTYSSATSNSTSTSFTLPHGLLAGQTIYGPIRYQNNNTHATTPGMYETANGSNVVTLYTGWAGALWTNTNSKAVGFELSVPF